jgi:serine/threonine protein kinase
MNGQAGFPRLIVASRAKGATFHACARIDAPSFAQMVGAQALGDLDDILRHGVGLARWIASFHARSYAHRDLSPEHVFATSPDQVTVVDLGLAKSLTGLSKRERSLCEGADIVSWGMIIWEMIRGSPIFSYQQPELRFELRSQRALISAVEMPEGLAQVLLRALDVSSIFTPNEEEQDGLFTACDLLAALDAL